MKRPTKFLLLFLALLLPALIFLFLKRFGRNEFKVPVLYQEEAIVPPTDCQSFEYTLPYVVPDSVLMALEWTPGTINLFIVGDGNSGIGMRLLDEFQGIGFVIQKVSSEMRSTAACALLLQPPANTVMVDDKGRIRGQYDIRDRDDADRLVVEMKIMLMLY